MPKFDKLNFNGIKEDWGKLKEIAEDQDLSVSQLMRRLIKEYIKKHDPKRK